MVVVRCVVNVVCCCVGLLGVGDSLLLLLCCVFLFHGFLFGCSSCIVGHRVLFVVCLFLVMFAVSFYCMILVVVFCCFWCLGRVLFMVCGVLCC